VNLCTSQTEQLVNQLPGWILAHPLYFQLKAPIRHTLSTIAAHCGPPSSDGSLIGARGGRALCDAIGLSRWALRRHARILEAAGFLVLLEPGGWFAEKNYSAAYGLPGSPGLLDELRYRRPLIFYQTDAQGRRQIQIVRPGGQAVFWPEEQRPPSDCTVGVKCTPGAKCTDGRSKMHPCSKNQSAFSAPAGPVGNPLPPTPPFPCGSTLLRDHSHHTTSHQRGGLEGSGRGGGVLRHGSGVVRQRFAQIELAELTETRRLLELLAQAVVAGLLTGSEHDELRFVAAAEHALRVGEEPCRLFASIVRRGHWLYLTLADEEAARQRLAAYRGERPAAPVPAGVRTAARPPLSRDAQLVRSALNWAKERGYAGDMRERVLRERPDWTAERWDAALRELWGANGNVA